MTYISRFKFFLIKLISIPIYILDYSYDFLTYFFHAKTQKCLTENKSLITANSQIALHKIQKSQTYPEVAINRSQKAWQKLNIIKTKYLNKIESIELTDILSQIDSNSEELLAENLKVWNKNKEYSELVSSRKSIRNFTDIKIGIDVINKILETAKYTPSVCNRQTWRVHFYSDKKHIDNLLKLQNGNSGWGHTIPNLIIITYDMSYFTTSSERNQGGIDAGMFSMNFILKAHSLGISTCCLNQSNYFFKEIATKKIGQIPKQEKIVMMIAIGYASNNKMVAKSQRYENPFFLTTH